jgi:hypothetical protein
VDLSLQLTAFLVSKLFCKKVEIAIYILGSSLLNNQYSLYRNYSSMGNYYIKSVFHLQKDIFL